MGCDAVLGSHRPRREDANTDRRSRNCGLLVRRKEASMSGESIAMAIFGMITGGALSAIAFSFGMVGRLSTIEEKINGLERRMDNMGIRLDNIKIDSPPCEFHVKLD